MSLLQTAMSVPTLGDAASTTVRPLARSLAKKSKPLKMASTDPLRDADAAGNPMAIATAATTAAKDKINRQRTSLLQTLMAG